MRRDEIEKYEKMVLIPRRGGAEEGSERCVWRDTKIAEVCVCGVWSVCGELEGDVGEEIADSDARVVVLEGEGVEENGKWR